MEKKTLGSMIAELRKEKGMTQADLAEKMGITDKAVSNGSVISPILTSQRYRNLQIFSEYLQMNFSNAGQKAKRQIRRRIFPSL